MATKAELEAELEALRKELAKRDQITQPLGEAAGKAGAALRDTGAALRDKGADGAAALADLLREHGLDPSEAEAIWNSLSQDLTRQARDNPLLTALLAFGLGFLAGRITR